MKVLILNKWGLTSLPFDRWLGAEAELFMICNPSAESSVPRSELTRMFAEVHVVEDYDCNPDVERLALAIGRRVKLDHILAMSETDLIRASRLRHEFGLDAGQSVQSAVAFRDKLVMKTMLRQSGVPTARFHRVDTYTDLVLAADDLGYPLVLKPRRGSSSIGIDVISNRDELDAVSRQRLRQEDDRPAHLLAEEFIRHDLYHVDGLVIHGETPYIWPSRMGPPLLIGSGEIRSVTLDATDPLVFDLQRLTQSAIAALPAIDISLFHAEVFRTDDGRLLLNEIASRIGGGRIKASFSLAHGVDLQERFVTTLASGANERSERASARHVPERSGGFLMVPPRPGTVEALPSGDPPAGVEQVRIQVAVGQRLTAASSSVDAIMSVTAAAPTAALLDGVLDSVQEWCEAGLRIAPNRMEETDD